MVQQVATGRAQFGVGNADQILTARDQEAEVVSVMAVMQNSPRCIMVHQETGITALEDLKGRKLSVGLGKSYVEFLKSKGILAGSTLAPYTGSIIPFLNDKQLAQQAYVFSEPHVAKSRGANVTTLMVSDLGFNPYSSCLFTTDELIQSHPKMVRQIVKAIKRGWIRYLRDPAATNAYLKKDNPDIQLESLAFGAEKIQALCLPNDMDESQFGKMTGERWETLALQLRDLGFLKYDANYRDAFTGEFIE